MVEVKPLNPIEPTGIPGVPDEPRMVQPQAPATAAQPGATAPAVQPQPVPAQSSLPSEPVPQNAATPQSATSDGATPQAQPNQFNFPDAQPQAEAPVGQPTQTQPVQPKPQTLADSIYPSANVGSSEPVAAPTPFHTANYDRPKGVYVIAGLGIFGSLYYLYVANSSSGNIVWFEGLTLAIIYAVVGLSVLLHIGLIMFKDIARKIFMVLAIVSVFYTSFGVVKILNAKSEVSKYEAQFQSQIDRSRSVTTERSRQIQTQNGEIFGKVQGLLTRALIVQLISIGISVVEVYYLSLPRVKNAFG